MSTKELTNQDLQALKTFKYIMNKKDEIKDEEYAKLISDVFLTSLKKICTFLNGQNTAKPEDLMKIISVLDDDVCQLYGNDPTGLKVLGKLKDDYAFDKVGIAAGEILDAYNILTKTENIAKAGASFIDSLSGFVAAASEFEINGYGAEFINKVDIATESFFGAVKGIVSFIPVVGTIATSIVDGLNWCYDQLFSFTSSRIKLLEEQTALCDYMSGQISKASFLSTIRNCVGDEKYFEYLEYFNAFQKAQDDLESKHGSSSATAIKTSIRDWSIARVIDLISSMSDDEKKDSDIQAIIQKYSLSISKSIGGTYVDPKEIDTITAIMGGVVDDANSATTKVVDPLAFDLKGDGFRLLSVSNGVYFDMDKNGTREKVGWIGGDDAFLAYDRNGDGIINDSGELFGDNTILKNGSKASTGFEALMEWDDNGDGIIDENDEIFNHLLVWQDINQDGISDPGELVTLSEAGIKAIRLDFTTQNITDSSGSILTRTAVN